jgi:hypothetical protein
MARSAVKSVVKSTVGNAVRPPRLSGVRGAFEKWARNMGLESSLDWDLTWKEYVWTETQAHFDLFAAGWRAHKRSMMKDKIDKGKIDKDKIDKDKIDKDKVTS